MPGLLQSIDPGSVAEQAALRPGDVLETINGHELHDMIDVQFYGADTNLTFQVVRDGRSFNVQVVRKYGQSLGMEFAHPTFDIDIRRCSNLCPFCFVLQNASHLRRSLYIKDDDYRYSFLYGHFVTLTNLQEEDWARIVEQHLSPLYVSVHATDLEIRRQCLGNPLSGDIMKQIRWLAKHDITLHTQLVITPDLNDGPVLAKSVRDLATIYPHVQSVSVVPVGLTKYHKFGHRLNTPDEAAAMIDTVEGWQKKYLEQLGVRFVYLTDEWYLVCQRAVPPKVAYDGLALQENGLGMVRDFINGWHRLKRDRARHPTHRSDTGHALLVTATLFAPMLERVARDFTLVTHVPLDVMAIKNDRLGESITVAGLLMGEDVIRQLKAKPDLLSQVNQVLLPRVMFSQPDGVTLDDLSLADIARTLGKPVKLAGTMDDVLEHTASA